MKPVFAIFGAGSIGCYVGGRLLANGHEVIFIGRPRIAEEIVGNGLQLTDHEKVTHNLLADKVRFETDPSAVSGADVILVCVKSMATGEAAEAIAAHGRKDAVVISLQNGATNADTLRAGLPGWTVAGGMVPYNVVNLGEGHFHRGTAGGLIIEENAATRAIIDAMNVEGLKTNGTDDIDGVLWGKVLINLNNAINMLSDRPLREELLDINYRRVWALCMKEGLAVLKKAGITPAKSGTLDPVLFAKILGLPNVILLRVAKGFSKIDDKARSSMWEDLQAGRAPEVDYINGAIVELGQKVGVPTPVNDKIISMVKDAFSTHKSPALSGAELLKAVRG